MFANFEIMKFLQFYRLFVSDFLCDDDINLLAKKKKIRIFRTIKIFTTMHETPVIGRDKDAACDKRPQFQRIFLVDLLRALGVTYF